MERLHARREHYLKRLLSTHLRSSEFRRYVELPAHIGGCSILDIGAGTSTTSMDFAQKGARVVALDLRFRNIDEVRTSSTDYFRCFKSNLDDPALTRNHPMLMHVYEHDRLDSHRFFNDFVGASLGVYIAGDLWHLPFADGSFDFVLSIRCLSDCFVDPDIFLEAVREALRVAKPGSSVQISPWQADYLSLGRGLPIGTSARQQSEVLRLLETQGINHRLKKVGGSDVQYLQLTRAPA
jgi:ubiquinone/menaquinone biosynthesis C-methylase UbiE